MGVFILDQTSLVRICDGRLTSRLLIADGYPCKLVDSEPDNNGVKTQYNKRLLDYRIVSVERMLDHTYKRGVVVITFERPSDGYAAIEFDNKDFGDGKAFTAKMHDSGVYAPPKELNEFREKFMSEFLTQLQRARAASQIAGRCGWTEDLKAFVLGTQIYKADGTRDHIRTAIAPGEMEGYHQAGDYDQWRRAFDIALSGGVDRQCVLALSIAGPLMVFTGLDGVLLNAYSPESGVGKSTLCDAALSIWGSPNVLRKDFRDTSNATFKLAAVSGNMPMIIDEFTNVEGRALSDYVYTITQGREKHRMTSDAKLAATGGQRWCLAAIATANNSVHDKLQSYRQDATAEAARVFEMRLQPLNIDPARMGELKVLLEPLRSSYGFLGPTLVAMFLSKSPDYWKQAVMSRIAKWDRTSSQSGGDRFRSATCALIEVGAALGKALGFAFQPELIEGELARHWTKQVSEFEAERKRPMDFINGYVLQHLSDFALIGGAKGDQLINPTHVRRFMGEMRGITKDSTYQPATLMIPMDHLRDYVREKNGNFKAVVEFLQGSHSVTRMGTLLYLANTVHAMKTNAVELKHADVVGAQRAPLSVVQTSQPQEHQA